MATYKSQTSQAKNDTATLLRRREQNRAAQHRFRQRKSQRENVIVLDFHSHPPFNENSSCSQSHNDMVEQQSRPASPPALSPHLISPESPSRVDFEAHQSIPSSYSFGEIWPETTREQIYILSQESQDKDTSRHPRAYPTDLNFEHMPSSSHIWPAEPIAFTSALEPRSGSSYSDTSTMVTAQAHFISKSPSPMSPLPAPCYDIDFDTTGDEPYSSTLYGIHGLDEARVSNAEMEHIDIQELRSGVWTTATTRLSDMG